MRGNVRETLSIVASVAMAGVLVTSCGSGTNDKPLSAEQQEAIARAAGRSAANPPASSPLDRLPDKASPVQGSGAARLLSGAKLPVFESPYTQKRPDRESPLHGNLNTSSPGQNPSGGATPGPAAPAPGQSGGTPQTTVRVAFQDVDWLAALPAPADEIPGVRIGWYLNAAIPALRRAVEQNKPLVLLIGEDWCDWCGKLAKSLGCAGVQRFADDAVFAYSMPSRDKGAGAIASSLEITAYPTLTVLEPEVRMLLERGRINGYFNGTTLGTHLETVLWQTPPRSYAEFEPAAAVLPPPARRQAHAATASEAEAGAKARGVTLASPVTCNASQK